MRIAKYISDHVENRMLNRRQLIKNISFFSVLYILPLSACKRVFYDDEEKPNPYTLSQKEKNILISVFTHLFPDDGTGPGIEPLNAIEHFNFVLNNKHIEKRNYKLLINGIRWVAETSLEIFNIEFYKLNSKDKEIVLRDLESFKNGEKWLSRLINIILEALLGSPSYNVNLNQVGWKWLNHTPGIPQSESNYIYGKYGYGI